MLEIITVKKLLQTQFFFQACSHHENIVEF